MKVVYRVPRDNQRAFETKEPPTIKEVCEKNRHGFIDARYISEARPRHLTISTSNSRPRDQPRRRQRDLVARTARVGREVRRRVQRLRALYRCASRAAAAVVGTQGKGASLGCARRSRSRCERPAAQSTGLSMEWGLGVIF